MNIYMTVGGKQEFIARFGVFNKEARKKLSTAITKWSERIYLEAHSSAPFTSGKLTAGISPQNAETLGKNEAIVGYVRSRARHSLFVEYGTGPMGASTNRMPRPAWHDYHAAHKFPSVRKLTPWAKAHGFDPWALARFIFKNQGVKARPFLQPAFLRHKEAIVSDLQAAVYSTVAETNVQLGKEIPVNLSGALA
jgi:HK97 gp10 family phage protein